MKYLVIDIGGTFTKYAVMDENAAFYEKGKIPTAKESEEGFLHMIEELYERYRDDADDALNPKKLLAETAGAPALIRLAAEETGIPVEELDGEKVFDMAQNGDERVLKALRRYTRRIAAHIMNCQFAGELQLLKNVINQKRHNKQFTGNFNPATDIPDGVIILIQSQ